MRETNIDDFGKSLAELGQAPSAALRFIPKHSRALHLELFDLRRLIGDFFLAFYCKV